MTVNGNNAVDTQHSERQTGGEAFDRLFNEMVAGRELTLNIRGSR
jgi:hypothetical protein